MNPKIKKMIAREGLIVVGLIVLALLGVLGFLAMFSDKTARPYWIAVMGLAAVGYPVYWLSRFIFWAIRTLKGK